MLRLICALLLFSSSEAIAGYLSNRGDWNDQNQLAKIGYVMGAADRHLMLLGGEENIESNARAEKQTACLVRLDVDAADLVQLVDEAYADIDKWSWTPSAVVMSVIWRLCKE